MKVWVVQNFLQFRPTSIGCQILTKLYARGIQFPPKWCKVGSFLN